MVGFGVPCPTADCLLLCISSSEINAKKLSWRMRKWASEKA